ncbi:MAG: hypothetical protein AAF493_20880 [Pseudomonadota bacterium]
MKLIRVLGLIGALASSILIAVSAQALEGSGGSASEIALVGKWRMVSEPVTIEFKPDGSYVAVSAQGLLVGRWEVTAENQLATWRSEAWPKRISRFELTQDSLVITDARGTPHAHRRIHSEK